MLVVGSDAVFDAAVKEVCCCLDMLFEPGSTEAERVAHSYISNLDRELSNPDSVREIKESYS